MNVSRRFTRWFGSLALAFSFPAAWNVPAAHAKGCHPRGLQHIRRNIVPLLEKHRGDLPLALVAGWVSQESDGCLQSATSLDERGYFQIYPEEGRRVLKLSASDFERVRRDSEFSVKQGIRLVQYYVRLTEKSGFARDWESFWPMVKVQHGGPGNVRRLLTALRKAGVDRRSWSAIRDAGMADRTLPSVIRGILRNADSALSLGVCITSSARECKRGLRWAGGALDTQPGSAPPPTSTAAPAPDAESAPRVELPAFPFHAVLGQGLGFRKKPAIDKDFVFSRDKYLEAKTRVQVLGATGPIGRAGTFCRVAFKGRRGFIRCDGNHFASVAKAPATQDPASAPAPTPSTLPGRKVVRDKAFEKEWKGLPGRYSFTALPGNGGRLVAVYLAPRFDPRKNVHLLVFFHGNRGPCRAALEGCPIRKRLTELGDKDPQLVFVLPVSGNPKSTDDTWMMARKGESLGRLVEGALAEAAFLSAAKRLRVGRRVVSAHSGGGRAIRNIVAQNQMQADFLELLDSFYGDWGQVATRWAKKASVPVSAFWTDHKNARQNVAACRKIAPGIFTAVEEKGHMLVPARHLGVGLLAGAPAPETSSAPESQAPAVPAPTVAAGEKPQPREQKRFCRKPSDCAPFCSGSRANVAAVRAAVEKFGYAKPTEMIDPALAIQGALAELGCKPAGSRDPRQASKNCGVVFRMSGKGDQERQLLPAVVVGLAKAALEAKSRGYLLNIGSTYRSPKVQTDKMCVHLAKGESEVCGSTLACPGASPHGSGYGVDLCLADSKGNTLTPCTGKAKDCKTQSARVKRDPKLRTLNDIMFAAGWYKYCKELWHFEYTASPQKADRRVTY